MFYVERWDCIICLLEFEIYLVSFDENNDMNLMLHVHFQELTIDIKLLKCVSLYFMLRTLSVRIQSKYLCTIR